MKKKMIESKENYFQSLVTDIKKIYNKVLILKNKSSSKETVIQEGQPLKIILNNGLVIHGELALNSNSGRPLDQNEIILYTNADPDTNSGSFQTNKVDMNAIKTISVPSMTRNSIGSFITASGIAAILVGLTWITQNNKSNLPAAFGGLFVLRGVIVTCFGLLTLAFIGRISYDRADWDYMVRFK